MERFYQAVAAIMLAVVLILTLRKQNPEASLAISVLVCCLVGCLAVGFLQPVVSFLKRLQNLGSLDEVFLRTLLKIVGVCFTAEICCVICEDSGNGALGKVIQFLASALILYLSLPMLTKLLDLLEGMLENL